MNYERRIVKRQKHNNKYTVEDRLELIRLVREQKISIKTAGISLGFKQSTAKRIVKEYRDSGKLTVFKCEREEYGEQDKRHSSSNEHAIEPRQIQNHSAQHQNQGLGYFSQTPQQGYNFWPPTFQNPFALQQQHCHNNQWQFMSLLNNWYYFCQYYHSQQ